MWCYGLAYLTLLSLQSSAFGQIQPQIVHFHRVSAVSDSTLIPQSVVDSYSSVGLVTKRDATGQQKGSATYLGDGLWLTNAHVVLSSAKGTFTVTLKSGQVLAARVLHCELDKEPDLAVVETSPVNLKPVAVADKPPAIGDLVFPSGFDRGRLEWHTIWPARVDEIYSGGDFASTGLGARKGAISGNSGGPTFNESGELIAPLNANNGPSTLTGGGGTVSVCFRNTRIFLLPWRNRVMRALQQNCPPNGQCYPQQPPQYNPQPQPSPVPRPVLPPNQDIPSFKPAPTPIAGTCPGAHCPGCTVGHQQDPPVSQVDIDYDRLAKIVIAKIADDDRFRGPAGPKGDKGDTGTVSDSQLKAMSLALLDTMRSDPAFRGAQGPIGPAGNSASVDVAKLKDEIKRDLNRRFIVLNGQDGTVIDDESYAFDEPFVLDVTRLQKAIRE